VRDVRSTGGLTLAFASLNLNTSRQGATLLSANAKEIPSRFQTHQSRSTPSAMRSWQITPNPLFSSVTADRREWRAHPAPSKIPRTRLHNRVRRDGCLTVRTTSGTGYGPGETVCLISHLTPTPSSREHDRQPTVHDASYKRAVVFTNLNAVRIVRALSFCIQPEQQITRTGPRFRYKAHKSTGSTRHYRGSERKQRCSGVE
jgi:hypothetical protein